MKLTQLPSGLSAVITRIDLPPALADRLEALGMGCSLLRPGRRMGAPAARGRVGNARDAERRRPDAARIHVALKKTE